MEKFSFILRSVQICFPTVWPDVVQLAGLFKLNLEWEALRAFPHLLPPPNAGEDEGGGCIFYGSGRLDLRIEHGATRFFKED